ncbi:MAG: gluconokinase [Rhizobiaceae bacterium]|nr:gluconokinase [Rhizobiaceae bacterium]
MPRSLALVVMGVAGSGKTTVGEALAQALGAYYIEGDRLQPPENVARMASGVPLTDEHRRGWLDAVGREVAAAAARGENAVAACSALKHAYRDRLRALCPAIRFLYLDVDPATAEKRVGSRRGHFMPASLVDSQFADLEPPTPDENALRLDATRPAGELVKQALALLGSAQSGTLQP